MEATNFQIALSQLLEAALLGFIGAIVGIVLGVLVIFVGTSFLKIISISVILPWWLHILVIALSALLSAVIAMISVYFNTQIDPVGVLRHE